MASETIETVGDKNVEKRGAVQFVADVREEMTRVSFPSRDDVRNTTVIVIVNVIFFAVFLFLVDQGWVSPCKAWNGWSIRLRACFKRLLRR